MDAGLFAFRKQLIYKTAMYGTQLVLADRWFPSSKRCSCCGSVKTELALSQRIFHCDECGFESDRDKNASMNLEQYPDILAASFAVSACGKERAGTRHKSRVKQSLNKQEPDSIAAE